MNNIRVYDSGENFLDRYTVLYLDRPEYKAGTFSARGMSENPFHPQGFGQYCIAAPGKHLGKRIKFEELPSDCQKLVLQDLKDE